MSAQKSQATSRKHSKYHKLITALVFWIMLILLVDTGHAGLGQKSISELIPAELIYADPPNDQQEKMPHAVIVDKSGQQITLFEHQAQWHMVQNWRCSTGKQSGLKQIEGDGKTPEGVYFVTQHVEKRFLTETYGSRALPLDFPNWLDRRRKRKGSAIWLHGTNKTLRPRDSNGCIVMMNHDIDDLVRYIQLRQTPVIIVGQLHWQTNQQAENLAGPILQTADQWHSALMGGGYEDFKQSYDFKAAPSMEWWRKWRNLRCRFMFEPSRLSSRMQQRRIFRDKEIYVFLFDHNLEAGGQSVWAGRRKLYLREQAGRISIVGDTYQARPLFVPAINRIDPDPLLSAWRRLWEKTVGHRNVGMSENWNIGLIWRKGRYCHIQ